MEVVTSLSQGRTTAAQCGLFTYKSAPVIFEPPCTYSTSITCSSQCIGLQVEMIGEAEFIKTWYSVGHNYVNTFISSVASKNNT